MTLVLGSADVERVVKALQEASYRRSVDAEDLRKAYRSVHGDFGDQETAFVVVARRMDHDADRMSELAHLLDGTQIEARESPDSN